jgi:hypothetical protein
MEFPQLFLEETRFLNPVSSFVVTKKCSALPDSFKAAIIQFVLDFSNNCPEESGITTKKQPAS